MLARVVTAAVAIPIVVAVLIAPSLVPLQVLITLAAAGCVIEFALAERGYAALGGALALAAVAFSVWLAPRPLPDPIWLVAMLSPVVWAFFLPRGFRSVRQFALPLFWVAAPFTVLVHLRAAEVGSTGADWPALPSLVLLLLICQWAGDTAAMLTGRSLGRHKIAPSISPSKTWEGSAANLAASLLVGWLLAGPLRESAGIGLVVGGVVGVFGQLGDFYQSAWKRSLGIKDSGAALPGHGGLLDRLDSLLLSAPMTAVFLEFFAKTVS